MKKLLYFILFVSLHSYAQTTISTKTKYTTILGIPTLDAPSMDFPGMINFFPGVNKFGVRDNSSFKYLLSETSASTTYMPKSGGSFTGGVTGTTFGMSGNMYIGTSSSSTSLAITKNITGATTSRGILISGTVQSDVTSGASYFATLSSTAASAFTLTSLYHFRAVQSTIGVGSTVTNQYGVYVDASLIGATNNFAYDGELPAGATNWNLYMNGAAKNYLGGNLLIGSKTDNGEKLQITGKATVSLAPTNATDVVRKTELDLKQNLVTLTTTGSGAATFNQSTGALNIPTGTGGTVTSFGKTDGYGITSSVANSTTTPVHTIAADTTSSGALVGKPRLTAALALKANTSLFSSGRYTPTVTDDGNVTLSTPYSEHYQKNGTEVTMSGSVEVTPAGAGPVVVYLTLPSGLTSNFTDIRDIGGIVTGNQASSNPTLFADVTGDKIKISLTAIGVTPIVVNFSLMYELK